MKKKSYRNKRPSPRRPIRSCDLPTPHPAEEGFSADSPGGGARGWSKPGEGVWPANITELEETPVLPRKKPRRQSRLDYDDLLNMLVELGDDMDKQDEVALAGIADFLIKKVAEQKFLDYSSLFGDLIVKIAESDILNKNKVFVEITKEYNKTLKSNMIMGNDISTATRAAYQASSAKAKEYVR